jgi:myo-inositol 2-dehydrogenase/D-chiro-inositol 1-dehydrogenase
MTINIGVIGTGAIGADHARRISKTLIGGKILARLKALLMNWA